METTGLEQTELFSDTLQQAKQELRDNWDKGTSCKCCGQFVKLYKRKLNSGMAVILIRLYKESLISDRWINVKDFLRVNSFKNNHDWTLLKYWGFIKQNDQKSNGKTKSLGEWKITDKGKDFVLNKITTHKRIHIYNKMYMGVDIEQTNIIECLGNHFNYNELMKS